MDEITAQIYRSEFPVTKKWTYLDHAAVAPLCKRAHEAMREWSEDLLANGDVNIPHWFAEVDVVRALAAQLIGAEAEEIALLKNTSEGIATVAEGFPWQAGDNVILVEGEYPANVYPWLHLASRGVSAKIVPCDKFRISLKTIEQAIDSRTRMLAISFVQFASGFRADLAAVSELCKAKKIELCVDAIQGLGVFPINVGELGIDYLAADGHKWLVGPEGGAIFYARRDKIEKLRPPSVGWKSVINCLDFSTIDYRIRSDAKRFESGSYHMPCLMGLGGSLRLFLEIGVDQIERRVRQLTDHLAEGLTSMGAHVISPRGSGEWSGIVSFMFPGRDTAELVRQCRSEGIVLSNRGGRLRASPHFYNTRAEIDHLLAVLSH